MAKKKNATRTLLVWAGGIIGILIILGVAGKMAGVFGGGNKGVEVETEQASMRKITQVVTASGKVQPEVEIKISPDVSGEIIDLRVREGDQVRQGDLLARIRPDFYTAQVEQAQAGVLQAQAALAQRKADLLRSKTEVDRQNELFDRKVIAEADAQSARTAYDVAKAAYDAAEYAVQSAQARLRETQEQLNKTSIYAPMTGTISQLNVEYGERVVGTSQMAGTEMMRVALLDRMEIEVDVNENDVINVHVGDTASVDIDAYPDGAFVGVVTEIANSARISGLGTQDQVTNFPVKVRIVGADGRAVSEGVNTASTEVPPGRRRNALLRPGMTGTVDIFTETVGDAVAVPIQAVTMRDFSKFPKEEASGNDEGVQPEVTERPREDLRKMVFVIREGKAEPREVETGIADDTYIEVTMGIAGGDTVIIGPYSAVSRALEPGGDVRIKKDDASGAGGRPGA